MEKIRVSAKTKDEAITKALIQLGITSDRLDYNVIVEGKSGLFGIGAKPWIIEASVKEYVEDKEISELEKDIDRIKANTGSVTDNNDKKPVNKVLDNSSVNNDIKKPAVSENANDTASLPKVKDKQHHKNDKDKKNRKFDKYSSKESVIDSVAPVEEKKQHEIKPISEEEANSAIHDAEQFITNVLNGMNMEVNTKSTFDHTINEILINLEGTDMGVLIGKRGQTLDSLQYLTSLVVNKNHKEDYIRIKIDTEDYRSRREATLRNLARNIAYKVRRSRKAVALEPMNPYERRIIHSALQNDRFVTTKSEGEEPFRHVIIFMKKKDRRNNPRENSFYKKEFKGNASTDEVVINDDSSNN